MGHWQLRKGGAPAVASLKRPPHPRLARELRLNRLAPLLFDKLYLIDYAANSRHAGDGLDDGTALNGVLERAAERHGTALNERRYARLRTHAGAHQPLVNRLGQLLIGNLISAVHNSIP